MKFSFKINESIPVELLVGLFKGSQYFPINDETDHARLQKMFTGANLVVSAWDDKLIGIARSLCDFSYCCYLSDICVHDAYKGKGVGKELISITKKEAGPLCKLILHSSDSSVPFYQKIGMKQIKEAFIIQREF